MRFPLSVYLTHDFLHPVVYQHNLKISEYNHGHNSEYNDYNIIFLKSYVPVHAAIYKVLTICIIKFHYVYIFQIYET